LPHLSGDNRLKNGDCQHPRLGRELLDPFPSSRALLLLLIRRREHRESLDDLKLRLFIKLVVELQDVLEVRDSSSPICPRIRIATISAELVWGETGGCDALIGAEKAGSTIRTLCNDWSTTTGAIVGRRLVMDLKHPICVVTAHADGSRHSLGHSVAPSCRSSTRLFDCLHVQNTARWCHAASVSDSTREWPAAQHQGGIAVNLQSVNYRRPHLRYGAKGRGVA